METINLFCLPFAGGNKYSYRAYEKKAPAFLKVLPVEYPGRGSRSGEPLLRNIDLLVDDVYNTLKPRLNERPYAIYGHSMGALAAYLLTVKMVANGDAAPCHLFVTGTNGPSAVARQRKQTYLLGRDEFMKEVTDMDGIPEEVLAHKELLDYIEPILRADFTATDTYKYHKAPQLDVPVTVITGTEEDMTEEEIHTWQEECAQTVDFIQMTGKHFFISKHVDEIMKIITNKILRVKSYQL